MRAVEGEQPPGRRNRRRASRSARSQLVIGAPAAPALSIRWALFAAGEARRARLSPSARRAELIWRRTCSSSLRGSRPRVHRGEESIRIRTAFLLLCAAVFRLTLLVPRSRPVRGRLALPVGRPRRRARGSRRGRLPPMTLPLRSSRRLVHGARRAPGHPHRVSARGAGGVSGLAGARTGRCALKAVFARGGPRGRRDSRRARRLPGGLFAAALYAFHPLRDHRDRGAGARRLARRRRFSSRPWSSTRSREPDVSSRESRSPSRS